MVSEILIEQLQVGTLLHEALHCLAMIDNKEICAKDEHQVIRELGDDC